MNENGMMTHEECAVIWKQAADAAKDPHGPLTKMRSMACAYREAAQDWRSQATNALREAEQSEVLADRYESVARMLEMSRI